MVRTILAAHAVRLGGQYRTFIYTKKVFAKGTKKMYYKGAIRESNRRKEKFNYELYHPR